MRPDIAAWLPHLPSIIHVDPWRAVGHLARITYPTSTVPHPGRRVDAWCLIAEIELRLHRAANAVRTSTHAIQAAQALEPFDADRCITARAIAADIAVRTGAADAAEKAIDYYTAIEDDGPEPDSGEHRHRLLLAVGLLATAGYHHDCTDGYGQLNALHTAILAGPTWDAGLTMVATALHSAQALCDGHRDPSDHGVPPPMPDGLLHGNPSDPPERYLADRLCAVTPRHTCHPTTETPIADPAGSHRPSPHGWPATVPATAPAGTPPGVRTNSAMDRPRPPHDERTTESGDGITGQ